MNPQHIRSTPRAKAALLLYSTLGSLLLAEVALRLLGYGPYYMNPEQRLFWQFDDRLGWTHRPGQEGVLEKSYFRTRIRINRKGLRDGEHRYQREDGVGRILVLGDSFAWGFGVQESERFSERLEAATGVEVVNAGVSGYSTDQELLWLLDEGVRYNPDLVLLVFCGNDEGDNHKSRNYYAYNKPRFVLRDGQSVLAGVPVIPAGSGCRAVLLARRGSALVHLTMTALERARPPHCADPNSELTRALLARMQTAARDLGADFLIVATGRYWEDSSQGRYEDFIARLQSDGLGALGQNCRNAPRSL